ncbi:calcium-binding protein [Corallincola platygyrae]|uniref:Calcium-binding protein n=1 Tax=Corallincola platygyrae TaxID=1193278 RepID=A0ABW4XLQ4_9GAMM
MVWIWRGVLNCAAASAFIGLLVMFGEADNVVKVCGENARILAAEEISKNSFFGAAETIEESSIYECRHDGETVGFIQSDQLWVDCKKSCSVLLSSEGLSGDLTLYRVDRRNDSWHEIHTWHGAAKYISRINVNGSAYDDVIVIDDDMTRCIDVRMDGLSGKDLLKGGCGNDLIYGSGGDDMILAQTGNDEIYGGTGNDRIWAGHGADEIFGQAGRDIIHGADSNDFVQGVDGEGLFLGEPGNLSLSGLLEKQAVRLKQRQLLSSASLSGSESLDFE